MGPVVKTQSVENVFSMAIVIEPTDKQQIVAENEKETRESLPREIYEALNAQVEEVTVMDLDIYDSRDDD